MDVTIVVPCAGSVHKVCITGSSGQFTVSHNPCSQLPSVVADGWQFTTCNRIVEEIVTDMRSKIWCELSVENWAQLIAEIQMYAIGGVSVQRLERMLQLQSLDLDDLLHWHAAFERVPKYFVQFNRTESLLRSRLETDFDFSSLTPYRVDKLLTAPWKSPNVIRLIANSIPESMLQNWLWRQIDVLRHERFSSQQAERLVTIGQAAAQIIRWGIHTISNPTAKETAEHVLTRIEADSNKGRDHGF